VKNGAFMGNTEHADSLFVPYKWITVVVNIMQEAYNPWGASNNWVLSVSRLGAGNNR